MTPRATNTATVLYLILVDDDGGISIVSETNAGANTISTTAAAPSYALPDQSGYAISMANPYKLEGGQSLWVATSVALASGWDATCRGLGYF